MSFNDQLDLLMRNCVRTFAEDGQFLYEPAAGAAKTVDAVFDHNYQLITLAGGAEVSAYHPVVKVHEKDFDQPILEDDKFTHLKTGKVYRVMEIQPDSGYGIIVILHSED